MSGAFEVAPLQEQVWVIMLNTKNLPIAREQCSVGTSSACMLNPTVVFRPAILANATAIIICHNHPSGNPTPSTADLNVTKDIVRAGKTLNISVHDHVIIADGGHYSFQERGLI
jgi:DNA repair protein RadC